MAAVRQDGAALRFAYAELKGIRDIVMAAVQQNGDALEYADDELKRDLEVIWASTTEKPIFHVSQTATPSVQMVSRGVFPAEGGAGSIF